MARRITDIVTEGQALGVVAGVAASVPVPDTAAEIAVTPAGSIAATNVQAALVELDTEKSGTAHTHAASGVSIADVGGYFTGADVEAALQELGAGGGGSGGALGTIHVRDQKATGTDGGTFTAGAWQTRTLNAVVTNTVASAALASNLVSLPAGTYEAEWSAPALQVNAHQSRLRDVTNNVTLALGQIMYALAGAHPGNVSVGRGRFTLAGTANVSLQHYCQTTASGLGFGYAASLATGELAIYSDLVIRKIS